LHEFDFQAGGDGAIPGWLTDQVLVSYSRYTQLFYDVQTGRFLFQWTSTPTGNGIPHQPPRVSSDGRWVFIWNSDSSKMYVLSRPAESGSTHLPSTPFGLLAYDNHTRQFELLFEHAVQAVWNADKSWAYIVYAEQDDKGKLGMAGGLWQPGAEGAIGHHRISEQMTYQDPARDAFFPAFPRPIPAEWSHDGERVAVCDAYGHLMVLSLVGGEQVLTEDLGGQGGRVALRWSPDDVHLLVERENRAWIVDVPNL